ncbi:hypothetical protein SLA2020_359690 [Shorea laevis]
MALKERNGKGVVPGKKQRRSWKKELEKGEKNVKCMKAEMGKLKANVKNMKAEGRKARKELKDKKRELAVIKEEHRLAAEDNAGFQLCFDVTLIMLILLAEDTNLVAAADNLFHSFL